MKMHMKAHGCSLLCLLFVACTTTNTLGETVETQIETSGAKAGVFTTFLLNAPTKNRSGYRPSTMLSIYTSLYLADGAFLPVQAAQKGIDAQQQILRGQTQPETSETFALLKEFGSILQVDIVDTLNRSNDRESTLGRYTDSLRNIIELAQRKMNELNALKETLQSERKEKKNAANALDRSIQTAIREENFEFASAAQEELVQLKAAVTELETKEEQTGDILKPYEKLMDVAKKRQNAIEQNRRILIAGLKVVNVPGIENLDILEEGKSLL